MHDRLDCDLHEATALTEIRLCTELIIAASESAQHLSPATIDRILGIDAVEASAHPARDEANTSDAHRRVRRRTTRR